VLLKLVGHVFVCLEHVDALALSLVHAHLTRQRFEVVETIFPLID